MLVLSRFKNQKVVITDRETGEKILLKVVCLRNNRVRIGFEASDRFTVHREEVQAVIDAEAKDESLPMPVDLLGLFEDSPIDVSGGWE